VGNSVVLGSVRLDSMLASDSRARIRQPDPAIDSEDR
jgi:hypothetical protein